MQDAEQYGIMLCLTIPERGADHGYGTAHVGCEDISFIHFEDILSA